MHLIPKKEKKCKKSLCLLLLALAVVSLYVTEGALLIARYAHPSLCANDTYSPEREDSPPDTPAYYFTVATYGICALVKCIEYIPLFIGFYSFYKSSKKDPKWKKFKDYCQCFWLLLIAPLMPLALSLFPLGIVVEYYYEKDNHCNDPKVSIFYTYCALNVPRYVWSFTVRAGMVLATLKVRELWNECCPESIEQLTSELGCDQGTVSAEKTAARLHKMLTNEYTNTGERVKAVCYIFQSWFLFPWIVFFLQSSLEAKTIVSIWYGDRVKVPTLPLVYY